MVLEAVFRLGFGNVVAAFGGFSTLLVAQFLGLRGDTFTVLQAVLDTQFWLTLHVIAIGVGYAATFVAGLLGIIYIIVGFFTRSLDSETGKALTRMTYGILCFAIFFSFWGTVLGGLWADDSWGRFWGWDPKETATLVVFLTLTAAFLMYLKKLDIKWVTLVLAVNVLTILATISVSFIDWGQHAFG